MDADRFDVLAKRMGGRASRRAALGSAATAGVLSALGFGRAATAQGGTCTMAFVATVRQGASAQQALTPGAARPGELRGELSFAVSATGTLENGALSLPDGTSLPVVGQATGHALEIRIELGQRLALVAVGVGEQEITACRGAVDGIATGPQVGDLGDWHAAVVGAVRGSGGQGGGNTQAQSGRETSGNQTAGTGRTTSDGTAGSGGSTTSPERSTGSGSCLPGQTTCTNDVGGNSCANLLIDRRNCGECGVACADALVCEDGVCGCEGGLTFCNGACVDTESDPDNCGTCGTLCPVTPELFNCEGGVCVEPSCDPLTKCGFLCVDTKTDSLHCGACDAACDGGKVCSDERCVCANGLIECFGACVDLQTDPNHCGFCGTVCPSGQCDIGQCVEVVGPAPSFCAQLLESCATVNCCFGFCGQDDICDCASDGSECRDNGECCNGVCNANGFCGACGLLGASCDSVADCCFGNYQVECCFDGTTLTTRCTDITDTGFCPGDAPLPCSDVGVTDCFGVCVDLMRDPNNCSACGFVCTDGPEGRACRNGECVQLGV